MQNIELGAYGYQNIGRVSQWLSGCSINTITTKMSFEVQIIEKNECLSNPNPDPWFEHR
jgi:hypothetical protein